MASEYGYTTVAAVEGFTGLDYSVIHAGFINSAIEAKITVAEKMVNAHMGVNGAQSDITDGIEVATIMITAMLLDENLNVLGYHAETEKATKDLLGMDIHQVLEHFTHDGIGIHSVPMSGADE